MSKRKSPEACIYCGSKGKLTKEHVYGKWLIKHYKFRSRHRLPHRTSLITTDSQTGHKISSMGKGAFDHRIPNLSAQVKIVCRSCNETWMSGIQKAVKPHLLEMAKGRWPRLDQKTVEQLAAWATMAAISINFATPHLQATNQDDRATLKRTLLPPPENWFVGAGLCRTFVEAGAFWHRAAYASEEPPESLSVSPNTQTTTFFMGSAFFHVLSAPADMFPAPAQYAADIGIQQLWPRLAIIPSRSLVFSESGVDRLSVQFWIRHGLSPKPHFGLMNE